MPRPWLRLEHSLVLLDGYLHPLFGARDFRAQGVAGEVPEGYDADGRSYMASRFIALQRFLPTPRLAQANIDCTTTTSSATWTDQRRRPAGENIVLKYFQYLALCSTPSTSCTATSWIAPAFWPT